MGKPAASGPSLVVRHTGQRFVLSDVPVTIGRQPDNIIVLTDPQASRHHATIFFQAGSYRIKDLGSANGTYVNDVRLTGEQALRDGDVIRMGNTVLEAKLGAMPAPVSPPAGRAPAPSPPAAPVTSLRAPLIVGLILAALVVVAVLAALILLAVSRGRVQVATSTPSPPPLIQVTPSLPPPTAPPPTETPTVAPPTAEPPTSTPTIAPPTEPPPTATPTPTATATRPPDTPTPTPTRPPLPVIEYFRANPAAIVAGQCTRLEWGKVSYATMASIDHGIGGVGTPGSEEVCPPETTTYILTATGPGGIVSAKATVTVALAPAYPYNDIWLALGGATGPLGAPTGDAVERAYVGQAFEHAFMFWQDNASSDSNAIYVIWWGVGDDQTEGDRWERFDDPWQEGDPVYSCAQATPPNGPIRSFGKLWCSRSSVRRSVGAPIEPEVEDEGGWLAFANGLMLWDKHNNRVFVLFQDRTWRAYTP